MPGNKKWNCVDRSLIVIGDDAHIDHDALLGYCTPRKITDLKLLVGRGAQIRSGSVIYAGSVIGDCLTTGHNVVIREENRLGNHVSIWSNSVIDYGCEIGNNVKIHSNVYVAQFTKIEDDVFIAPGVTIANDIHPGCEYSKECMKGPTIKRGAQIGVNVTLLPFITVGEYSVIGSGSVVTKDIPPCSVAYGNPAKVVKKIDVLECTRGITDKPYSEKK